MLVVDFGATHLSNIHMLPTGQTSEEDVSCVCSFLIRGSLTYYGESTWCHVEDLGMSGSGIHLRSTFWLNFWLIMLLVPLLCLLISQIDT